MKSSNNIYLANLDHLRAFAAFSIFIFHFIHNSARCLNICGDNVVQTPIPPFSLLEEGESGVSLFMCLSGYVFCYLTYGYALHPLKFIWNRLLRLAPLLLFCHVIISLFYTFEPTTGTWTIIIELQFYALLPILMLYVRAYGVKPLIILLAVFIFIRWEEWFRKGTTSSMEIAYYTLLGRADQLLLGMMAYYAEKKMKASSSHPKRIFNCMAMGGILTLSLFYYYFAQQGGFYHYPIRGRWWVVIPTIDGICYSLLMLWYLQLAVPRFISRVLSGLGCWSYSIYLSHFFIIPIFLMNYAAWFRLSEGFYSRLALGSLVAFPIVAGLSALTYHIIEKPFLRFRTDYLMAPPFPPRD